MAFKLLFNKSICYELWNVRLLRKGVGNAKHIAIATHPFNHVSWRRSGMCNKIHKRNGKKEREKISTEIWKRKQCIGISSSDKALCATVDERAAIQSACAVLQVNTSNLPRSRPSVIFRIACPEEKQSSWAFFSSTIFHIYWIRLLHH